MRLTIALLLMLSASPVLAQEQHGCDKFAWPVDAEKAALTAADKQVAATDSQFDRSAAKAIAVELSPFKDAKLAKPPERAPKKSDSFATILSFAAGKAGKYKVTLSDAGWIDLIQNESYLKPVAFTGALDCAGVRKSVEFEIGADAFVLQLSDVGSSSTALVLTPSE